MKHKDAGAEKEVRERSSPPAAPALRRPHRALLRSRNLSPPTIVLQRE